MNRVQTLINLSLVVIACALTGGNRSWAQEEPPISVEISAPVGKAYRPGYPFPVKVTIKNNLSAFNGTATIRSTTTVQQPLLTIPVAIGPGTFSFDLAPSIPVGGTPGLAIDLTHVSGALIYRTERLLSKTQPGSPHVLIAATPESKKTIAKILNPLPPLPGADLPQEGYTHRVRPYVAPLTQSGLAALPKTWTSFAMFEYLIWDGTGADRMTREQQKALSDWVYMGGTLLISPSTGILEIPSPSPNLFSETKRTDDIPESGIHLTHGYGKILIQSPPNRQQDLTESITSSQSDETPSEAPLDGALTYPEFQGQSDAIDTELRHALAKSVGYADHTFLPLMILGLLYIFSIALLDPIVLKTFKISWATWITMPLLTVLFSVGAAIIFKSNGVAPVGHAYIQIVDTLLDGSAREISVDCIRTPAQQHPSVSLKSDELAIASDVSTLTSPLEPNARVRRPPTLIQSYSHTGEITAILEGGTAYTFVHRKRPLRKQPLIFDVSMLKQSGEYLQGRIKGPSEIGPIFAFIYWDGWFYELDSNLKVVRRSMKATDKQLIRRLTANLPNSIHNAGPLGLARLAEQTARISISNTAIENRKVARGRKSGGHSLSALAPTLPAGYGILCVVTNRPQATDNQQNNQQAVVCYRQLFTAPN